MEGFIQIHRKILDWEWYNNEKVLKVFIHCLLRANHKDTTRQGIQINRGEFITSYEILARETNLSIQNIRTIINKLKSTGELTSKSTNKNTIIKLNNYDSYQANQQANQQTTNKQLTTDNNDNKYISKDRLKKEEIKQEAIRFIDRWNTFFKKEHKATDKFINKYLQVRIKYLKEDLEIGAKNYITKNKENLSNNEWKNKYYLEPLKFISQSNGFINYL